MLAVFLRFSSGSNPGSRLECKLLHKSGKGLASLRLNNSSSNLLLFRAGNKAVWPAAREARMIVKGGGRIARWRGVFHDRLKFQTAVLVSAKI